MMLLRCRQLGCKKSYTQSAMPKVWPTMAGHDQSLADHGWPLFFLQVCTATATRFDSKSCGNSFARFLLFRASASACAPSSRLASLWWPTPSCGLPPCRDGHLSGTSPKYHRVNGLGERCRARCSAALARGPSPPSTRSCLCSACMGLCGPHWACLVQKCGINSVIIAMEGFSFSWGVLG